MTTQEELPPLPEQDCCTHVTDSETMDLFRADQMRDYARQCIATLKAENARAAAESRELREALRCHGETVPCESCDCPMGAAARKFDAAIKTHRSYRASAAPQEPPHGWVMVRSIYDRLQSVLCDPEGKCCISGSNADRYIVDVALADLAMLAASSQPQAAPQEPATYWLIERNSRHAHMKPGESVMWFRERRCFAAGDYDIWTPHAYKAMHFSSEEEAQDYANSMTDKEIYPVAPDVTEHMDCAGPDLAAPQPQSPSSDDMRDKWVAEALPTLRMFRPHRICWYGTDRNNPTKGAAIPMIPDSWRFSIVERNNDVYIEPNDNGPWIPYDAVKPFLDAPNHKHPRKGEGS
jgi:hypothetical protein